MTCEHLSGSLTKWVMTCSLEAELINIGMHTSVNIPTSGQESPRHESTCSPIFASQVWTVRSVLKDPLDPSVNNDNEELNLAPVRPWQKSKPVQALAIKHSYDFERKL